LICSRMRCLSLSVCETMTHLFAWSTVSVIIPFTFGVLGKMFGDPL